MPPLAQHSSSFIPLLPLSRSNTLVQVPQSKFDTIEEHDPVWERYVDAARGYDTMMVDEWNKCLDVILVFIGLFIAVLTAFIIETEKQFSVDPAETTDQILVNISQQLFNSSTPAAHIQVDPPPVPLDISKVIFSNTLLFVSLAISIGIAMLSMAAKLWLIRYMSLNRKGGSPYDRAMRRQEAFSGIEAWKLHRAIDSLPLWTLLAVLLFGIFIHSTIHDRHEGLGYVIGVVFLIGLTFFILASCSAAFIPSAPFHSPFSHFISFIFNRIILKNRTKKWRLRIIVVSSIATGIMTILLVAINGSIYQLLIFLPIVGAFAVAKQPDEDSPPDAKQPKEESTLDAEKPKEPGDSEHSPLYGPSALAAFGSFTVFIPIAVASYFSASRVISISVSSVISGVLLPFYGYQMYKLTRVPNMLEAEAIAWLLKLSQESSLIKQAGSVATTSARKVLLLHTIVPLLPHIIAPHLRHSSGEHANGELHMLLSCLAHLSQFPDVEKSHWGNRAEQKCPKLSQKLRIQLNELRSNADPGLRDAAESILVRFGYGAWEYGKSVDRV